MATFHKAVIAAAGLSTRLRKVAGDLPKVLLKIKGVPLIQRSVRLLGEAGIRKIAVVTGYQKEKIINCLGDSVTYLTNPDFEKNNNMASLGVAKDFVGWDPFLYLHGDIIFDKKILPSAIQHFSSGNHDMELVTDFCKTDEEMMKVRVTSGRLLIESNKEIDLNKAEGEWTGIALIRDCAALFQTIEQILTAGGLLDYDTSAFTRMAGEGKRIYCFSTEGLPWIEIDFPEDYEKARKMFE